MLREKMWFLLRLLPQYRPLPVHRDIFPPSTWRQSSCHLQSGKGELSSVLVPHVGRGYRTAQSLLHHFSTFVSRSAFGVAFTGKSRRRVETCTSAFWRGLCRGKTKFSLFAVLWKVMCDLTSWYQDTEHRWERVFPNIVRFGCAWGESCSLGTHNLFLSMICLDQAALST